MKLNKFFPALLISSLMSSVSLAQLNIKTLAEARGDLHAPEYSTKQRETVIDQAQLFLSNMYVHRELKLKDFGASADFANRLKDLKQKVASVSDDEFHQTMQKIFRDLHDLHTNYTAPLPLGCSYVISPMVFRDVVEDGQQKIIFESIARLFKDREGPHRDAKILDELVAVDGVNINAYMDTVRAESGGANTDAMTVFGLMNLTIRSLSELPVPDNDTVTYTFQGENGRYDIKTDLYAIVNERNCVAAAESRDALGVNSKRRLGVSDTDSENPRVKVWKKFVAPERVMPFSDDILNEIADLQEIRTPAGRITIMSLFTFMPENSSIESLVHRVKEELMKRQLTSDALIVDVRGNGGGAVKLAEELVQIFTPSVVEPMPVRLLPNQLNLEMFMRSNDGSENAWSAETKRAMDASDRYTKPLLLTTTREANRFGQVWFKPVVVLTDASCYSACDLFAAGMQDHAAATVIGTHHATGAGGANVMEYGSFRAVFGGTNNSDNPFVSLPGNQSFRVSWRQTIRVGKNAGKLIENYGITPDIVIPYKRDDLAGGESREVMRSIHREIDKLLPRYKSSIALVSSVRMSNGERAAWVEKVKGVDSVDVMLDGVVVESYKVDSAGEELSIELGDVTGEWENKRFDVVGKISGKTAFRSVRQIYWRGEDTKLTRTGLKEDLKTGLKYTKITTSSGRANDGWQLKNGILRVGSGPNYKASVVSEAFIPLNVEGVRGSVVLNIDFKLQTENGMDMLNIIARDPDTGRETYIYSLDGNLDTTQAVPVEIPHNGKRVEIVLEFESDENWNMVGPEIREINVKSRTSMQPVVPVL